MQRTVSIAGHVLRDVSLDIEHGSVVCLTGPSGAGKSVLLKILAGAIPPTSGTVEIYGQVTSLLTVGDNLDERHTAYENITAAAEAAGMAPDAVPAYVSDVIAFAGLQGFEHVPLRTFSTGMTLRLSAALALCGRPPIVLIDDLPGVGDIAFQEQFIDRLHALKEQGCTLVAAFSDEALVQGLATRVITLAGGQIVSDTPPAHWQGVRRANSVANAEWQVARTLPEDDVMALRSIVVAARRDGGESCLDVSLGLESKDAGLRCRPNLVVMRGRTVLFRTLYPEFLAIDAPRAFTCSVRIPTHLLPIGRYTITVSIATLQGNMVYSLKADDAVVLEVQGEDADAAAGPLLLPVFPWEVEKVSVSSAEP